jgi:hypothetical protein
MRIALFRQENDSWSVVLGLIGIFKINLMVRLEEICDVVRRVAESGAKEIRLRKRTYWEQLLSTDAFDDVEYLGV